MSQHLETSETARAGVELPINVFEYEQAARPLLAPLDYDYIAGGATDEVTLRRTREAFDALELRPRILQGVHGVDLSTTVLGTRVGFPVLLSPAGGHKKAHPDGELATTRAAAAMESLAAISAHSSYPLEEIAAAAPTPLWCQIYFYKDRELIIDWLRRAEEAGCKALCITADAIWPPKRERVIRHKLPQPTNGPQDANGGSMSRPDPVQADGSGVIPRTGRELVDPGATWEDIAWIKSRTSLPVVVKGIMTGEDTMQAARYGIDGVIVSSHGGRNVDTTQPTIEALPEVVAVANGKLEVYLDGGIRRGTDVMKALALGARAVFIGRPIFWGLAVDGDAGLHRLLAILREEMESAMVMCGRPNIASLEPSLVARAR